MGKRGKRKQKDVDMLPEYDFSKGVKGKYSTNKNVILGWMTVLFLLFVGTIAFVAYYG